ncbi:MAG: hypothetical protein GX153_12480 [Clostridiaceae bacterium]|nr:hypothetical protein [Clostridiaceae bacterium]
MSLEEKQPYTICWAGGRQFQIYLEYDEQLKESYPAYPDFDAHPEYTKDGQPFATAEQESCPYGMPRMEGAPLPCDCGGCKWFSRENTPYDPIGVCICSKRRRESGTKSEEEKR